MGERVNIAAIAEVISGDLFSKFGWENHGAPNESWHCDTPEHAKKDHPTDVNFVYRDPYTDRNVHLITDLKSYAASSVNTLNLADAIRSLALAVDCAPTNPSWRDLYLKSGADFEVQGLLFVYNHDREFDRSFPQLLEAAFQEEIRLPRKVRLTIIGPDDVWHLYEIINDMANLMSDGAIPPRKDLSYFYHSHARNKLVRSSKTSVATIDVLKGKYQLVTYTVAKGRASQRGMLMYYRGPGKEVREFIVLIDMLRAFGALDDYDEISVRCTRAVSVAPTNFKKAISAYAELPSHQDLPENLKKLKYASVPSVRPRVTQFEIALRS